MILFFLLTTALARADGPTLLDVPASPFQIPADDLLATGDEARGWAPSVSLGLSGTFFPSPDRLGEQNRSVLGPALTLGLAYNLSFFLRPYLELGYLTLYSSRVDTGAGVAEGKVSGVTLLLGPSYRRFGFRARAGIGATQLRVRSEFQGTKISADELDLTESLTLGGQVYKGEDWWAWLEARSYFILASGNVVLSLGLTVDYGGWLGR